MSRSLRPCVLTLAAALLCVVAGCAVNAKCDRPECAEDAAIRTEVERLQAERPELRPPNMVYVQVHAHRVTLSGQVNSEYERRLAESVARQAKGVTDVVNMIGLTYTGR